MGARASRPTEEQATHLRSNYDHHCHLAASALHDADALLLVTGAGFSADSGLATYDDVAKVGAYRELGLTYRDLCQPRWLHDWPAVFYGFWGQCFDDYRDTGPHGGYDIVARWRDDKNNNDDDGGGNGGGGEGSSAMAEEMRRRLRELEAARRANEEALLLRHRNKKPSNSPKDDGDGGSSSDDSEMDIAEIDAALNGGTRKEPYSVKCRAGAFFAFTSNVDAHSYDVFHAEEIRECHGNVELWQCGRSRHCPGGSAIWRAPMDFRFEVDPETMLAPAEKTADARMMGLAAKTVADERSTPSSSSSDAMQKPTGGDKNPKAEREAAVAAPERAHVGHTLGGTRPHTLRFMLDPTPTPSPPSSSDDDGDGDDGGSRSKWITNGGRVGNYPTCPRCGSPARPAVLMFDDSHWIDNDCQAERWSTWKAALYDLCLERTTAARTRVEGGDDGEGTQPPIPPPPPVRVCIIEVGCGDNVATCRRQSEHVTREIVERGGEATLVRVNPDYPLADDTDDDQVVGSNVISIMARGLETLKRVDHHYQLLRRRRQKR